MAPALLLASNRLCKDPSTKAPIPQQRGAPGAPTSQGGNASGAFISERMLHGSQGTPVGQRSICPGYTAGKWEAGSGHAITLPL